MIKAQVNGVEELGKKFQQLAHKIGDTEKTNRKVALDLQEFVFRNFQTEGGMTEERAWAPLADSTLDWKEKRGYSMILQNAGELRQSFLPFHDRTVAGVGAQKLGPVPKSYTKEQKRKRGKKSDSQRLPHRPPDIAAVHEYGSADGRVPARPMLPTREQALGIGIRVYEYHIDAARKESKL